MKVVNVAEQLSAMQQLFLPASAFSDSLRKNARRFWETQDKVLGGMQAFTDGRFERRHTGAQVAMEATQRMCKAETPVDLLREYQDWAIGAHARAMADALAWREHLITIVIALPRPSGDELQKSDAPGPDSRTHTRSEAA
jgi:hypothetical protein